MQNPWIFFGSSCRQVSFVETGKKKKKVNEWSCRFSLVYFDEFLIHFCLERKVFLVSKFPVPQVHVNFRIGNMFSA